MAVSIAATVLLCLCAIVPPCLAPEKTETAKQVPARFGKLVELRFNIHGGPAVGFYEPEDDNLVTNSSAKHDTAQHGTALHITAHHITSRDILDQRLQGQRATNLHTPHNGTTLIITVRTTHRALREGVDVAIFPGTGGGWVVAGGVRLALKGTCIGDSFGACVLSI